MPEAIVTVGISASGKTTWAESFTQYHEVGDWVNINRDDIRFNTFCRGVRDWNLYKWKRSKENRVTEIYNQMIDEAYKEGLNIVCSDTNLNGKYRDRLISRLEDLGYDVRIKEFPVTLEEAWKRDARRNNGVGHEAIYKQWQRWLDYKGRKKIYSRRE